MRYGKSPKQAVIVDGYFTGRELLHELLERGVECFHLQSTPSVPASARQGLDASSYRADLGYRGDPRAAAAALAKGKPLAMAVACGWGAAFADEVALALALPSNSAEGARARRDTYSALERIGQAGIAVPVQAVAATLPTALGWVRKHGTWPVVIKPIKSAFAEAVRVCYGETEVELACVQLLNRRSQFGSPDDVFLLQSFASGRQFVVNTVSVDGHHYVTDAWHMTLNTAAGSTAAPREMHLLDPAQSSSASLFRCARQALAALGVRNGAAHTKLKWAPNGLTVIESGAGLLRIAMDHAPYRAAGLHTQAGAYAVALAGPVAARDQLFRGDAYSPQKHVTKLFFVFDEDGEIRNVRGLARLRALPSFHAHYRPLAKGEEVTRTTDTRGRGGVVYLVHESREQIARDVETIREWERGGELYDIAPHEDLDAFIKRRFAGQLACGQRSA
jgi:hypothetical protein